MGWTGRTLMDWVAIASLQAQAQDLVLLGVMADRFAALVLTCVRSDYPTSWTM